MPKAANRRNFKREAARSHVSQVARSHIAQRSNRQQVMHGSVKIDDALHAVRVAHGPAQWRAESARLHALFQSTHDARHLRALRRHNEAIEKWERNPES
jgi:hypothetical protein